MKLKKGIKIEYKVDIPNRKVVAYANNVAENAYCEIYKYFASRGVCIILPYDLVSIPNSFVGIASCHEEDEFDIVKGKNIAKEKLYAKYDASLKKAYSRMFKKMNNILSEFSEDMKNI